MSTEDVISWILEQEAPKALQWLQNMFSDEHGVSRPFNWLGLAECATDKAWPRLSQGGVPDRDWAYIAALSYQYLAEREKNNEHLSHNPEMKQNLYRAYQLKLMRIRVRSILTFGLVVGDPLLDLEQLVESFFEGITLSPDAWLRTFETKSENCSFAEKMEVRWINQRMEIMQKLRERQLFPEQEDLVRWFSAWDQICSIK
jgi:hypothetical protein